MYYHFLQTVLRLNCVGSVERKTQRSRLTRQPEPVATRLSRHIVGMRDGIDCRIAPVFTVDQLAACSIFAKKGCEVLLQPTPESLVGPSSASRTSACSWKRIPLLLPG